ncbi:MAG: DUF4923 family protein [Rikenellaceae bacterium]
MKKLVSLTAVCFVMLCGTEAKAQLSNILNTVTSAVTSITGGETLSSSGLAGTWTYSAPSLELESDGVLSSLAGSAASTQIESKLTPQLEKVGIVAGSFSFTFGSDLSFSCVVKGQTLSGTYTLDSSNDKIALKFSVAGTVNIGTINAYARLSGTSLSLLFSADAALSFVEKLSSITGSSTTLSTVSSLLENYDGLLVGFGFTSGSSTTSSSTSSAVSSAASALKSLF